MTVRPTLERYVYSVQSESNAARWYRVDLTANFGGGQCSCTDWSTRRQPALNAGIPILTKATLCKHAKAAFWHFLREVMPKLAEEETIPKRKTHHEPPHHP